MADEMPVGRKVRAERKMREWTLEDLAAKMEISTGYLALLERGERRWNEDLMRKASLALGVYPRVLMSSYQGKGREVLISEIMANLARIDNDEIEAIARIVQIIAGAKGESGEG